MTDASTDAELLDQWRSGTEDGAAELVARYAPSLLSLVRRRLSSKLGGRVDAEDIVQSALRSFFVAAREAGLGVEPVPGAGTEVAPNHGGDLWRLLVTVTLNKLRKVVRRHTSQKRSVRAEVPCIEESLQSRREQLSPLEALAIMDELESILHRLPQERRPILELRLAGYELEAIAASVGCSQRTVRRVLDGVKSDLQREQGVDNP